MLSKISISNIEGSIIYNANPINQFNEFSAMSKEFKKETVSLYVSNTMLESLDIKENDKVNIETSSGNIQLDVKVDTQLDGNIGYVPTFDKKIDTKALFESYRFTNANIKKV